jgi:hypothetical protein
VYIFQPFSVNNQQPALKITPWIIIKPGEKCFLNSCVKTSQSNQDSQDFRGQNPKYSSKYLKNGDSQCDKILSEDRSGGLHNIPYETSITLIEIMMIAFEYGLVWLTILSKIIN